MKVTEILEGYFNEKASPGTKIKCVYCGKNTLSIKSDNTIAKCFHPKCGKVIRSSDDYEINANNIHAFFDEICFESHHVLLNEDEGKNSAAYQFLVSERKINVKVIGESMIGVVPKDYDISTKIDAKLEALDSIKNKLINDYEKLNKEQMIENAIEILKKEKEKLIKLFKYNVGDLMFFYTDDSLKIISIKFRKPFQKKFTTYKIGRRRGVFGLELFIAEDKSTGQLVVTEGEFDDLSLQSLAVNNSNGDVRYHQVVSIGSSVDPDFETIKKIDKNPIFIHDSDDAGYELIERAKVHFHGFSTRTDKPFKDVDELIDSFGTNYGSANKAIQTLLEKRSRFYRNFEPIEKEVNDIRVLKQKDFVINQNVYDVVLDDLVQRGKFYIENKIGYYFNDEDNKLSVIDKSDLSLKLLLSKLKLTITENITNYIIANLQLYPLEKGLETKVQHFCFYEQENHTIYLSNFDNQIYKINREDIELVPNGTDGVLFLNNRGYEKFEYYPNTLGSNKLDEILIDQINFEEDDVLTIDERKWLFKYFIYSIFLESIMRTKVLVYFVGEKGSGKSITSKKLGLILFGNFDVTPLSNDPSDFDVAVSNSTFMCIDNADTKQEWLEDRLAVLATSGRSKRRMLYTTNDLVEIESRCFITLTARTPRIRRDDLADRMLIFNLKRFEIFKAESRILKEVLDNRNLLISEIIRDLQPILSILEEMKDYNFESNLRMADYADLGYKISCITNEGEV